MSNGLEICKDRHGKVFACDKDNFILKSNEVLKKKLKKLDTCSFVGNLYRKAQLTEKSESPYKLKLDKSQNEY